MSCEDQETERVRGVEREREREREGVRDGRDSGRGERREGERCGERPGWVRSDRAQTLSPHRSTAETCHG